MLERYERLVAPAAALVDTAASERIGQRWRLTEPGRLAPQWPVLVVAGRQDSTVGYAAAVDFFEECPRATLAVVDGAGHALPHEQPELLAGLLHAWLGRVATDDLSGRPVRLHRPEAADPVAGSNVRYRPLAGS